MMAAKYTATLADKVAVRGILQDKEIARRDMQAEMGQTSTDNRATETELKQRGIAPAFAEFGTWIKEHPGVALHSYQSLITKIFGGEKTTGYDILGRRMDEGGDIAAGVAQKSRDILGEWDTAHKGLGSEEWFSERGKISAGESTKELTRAQRFTIAGS